MSQLEAYRREENERCYQNFLVRDGKSPVLFPLGEETYTTRLAIEVPEVGRAMLGLDFSKSREGNSVLLTEHNLWFPDSPSSISKIPYAYLDVVFDPMDSDSNVLCLLKIDDDPEMLFYTAVKGGGSKNTTQSWSFEDETFNFCLEPTVEQISRLQIMFVKA